MSSLHKFRAMISIITKSKAVRTKNVVIRAVDLDQASEIAESVALVFAKGEPIIRLANRTFRVDAGKITITRAYDFNPAVDMEEITFEEAIVWALTDGSK